MDLSPFAARSIVLATPQRVACLDAACARVRGVPGHVVEVGTHKGGTLAYLSRVFPDRRLVGFDRFEDGFSAPDPVEANPHWREGLMASDYQDALDYLDALDIKNVRLVRGDVGHTLPREPDYAIALGVVDLDLYRPTLDALRWCWSRLAPGGHLLVDDFDFKGVFAALVELRQPFVHDGFFAV